MGNVCCPSSVPEKDIESRYDIVYCFVNSKSGGGVGKSLLKLKLKRLEYTNGTIRVVDLLTRCLWSSQFLPVCHCVCIDLLRYDIYSHPAKVRAPLVHLSARPRRIGT